MLHQVLNTGLLSGSLTSYSSGKRIAEWFSNKTFTTNIGNLYFNTLGETRWDLFLSFFDPTGHKKVIGSSCNAL